jgi:hypothetical protein
MAQVVEEFIAQTLAHVRTGYKPGNIQQFNGNAAHSSLADAVVRLASRLQRRQIRRRIGSVACQVRPRAGAWYLEIAHGAVGVYGGEWEVA